MGKLEESVADSAVFLIFLSKGYFRSFNCRRELYAAFASDRPIVVIHEADEAKGGATIEALKEECRVWCIEEHPDTYPAYSGPEEALRRVFGHDDPVLWVRVTDCQIVSLKAIACRILPHLLYYTMHPTELAAGLRLAGELGPVAFSESITLLVYHANTGAHAVAEEIRQAATVGRPRASTSPIVIEDAANAVTLAASEHAVLLIYLTKDTFLGSDGVLLADVVQRALNRKIRLVLVHEQEPSKGACAFSVLIGQTPDFLFKPPYKIFDTVAVPLYSSPEHREISLRQVLMNMGGQQSAGTAHQLVSAYLKIPFVQRLLAQQTRLQFKLNKKAPRNTDQVMAV